MRNPPCRSIKFERLQAKIESSTMAYLGERVCKTVVDGDFNAHSTMWGDRCTDNQENLLCTLCDFIGFSVVNLWDPTFFCESVVNVIMVSKSAFKRLKKWNVHTDYENMSGHYHITLLLVDCITSSSLIITTPLSTSTVLFTLQFVTKGSMVNRMYSSTKYGYSTCLT